MPSTVAREMRATAETHSGNPYQHSMKTHANWDYWYVPGLYTYLRTDPETVLGARLMDMFRTRLAEWTPPDSVISASMSMVAGRASITVPPTGGLDTFIR
jgi:hypothetical protein